MTQATSAPGWPVLRGIQTVKEVSYLNMRQASAASALAKLWSDTFLTNAGIYAAGSSGYTYRGSANFDVIRQATGTVVVNNMTANNLPSPFVASSPTEVGANLAWKAFDGDDTTSYYESSQVNSILKLDCGANYTVASYKVLGYPGGTYAPAAWTVEGSATGAFAGEETVLDTQTGQDTTTKKTYTIASPQAFRYYRIHVTAVNSAASCLIKSFELWTAAAATASIVSVLALDLAADVTQVMMFSDVTLGTGTAAYYVSTNDGSTWTAVALETLATVPAGKKIRLKVELTGDAGLNSWGVAV